VNGALGIITAYAQNNGGTAPTESSFAMAGISGVTASNLVAMQSALLAASVQGTHTDSIGEVQAIVSAYGRILGEANGAAPDTTPTTHPTTANYSLIGANVAASLGNGSSAQLLLNSAIAQMGRADVDTVPKIDARASVVQRLMLTAASTPNAASSTAAGALTAADLALLGLVGVDSLNLPLVLGAIASSANDGSAIDSFDKRPPKPPLV
jgi:hypothetical protein